MTLGDSNSAIDIAIVVRRLALLTLTVIVGPGCATIVSSSTQPMTVTAVCEGQVVADATCTLSNDKGQWVLKAPGNATVHKSYRDLVVECSHGANHARTQLTSMSNTAFANIVAGGIAGYAIDSSTGAGFDYPAAVTVVFNPPCATDAGSIQ